MKELIASIENPQSWTIEIKQDYEGYFESLVRSWIAKKNGPLKHSKFIISSGRYRVAVVSYKSSGGELHLDFYAAFRRGFGKLSEEEVKQIIDLL